VKMPLCKNRRARALPYPADHRALPGLARSPEGCCAMSLHKLFPPTKNTLIEVSTHTAGHPGQNYQDHHYNSLSFRNNEIMEGRDCKLKKC